MCLVSKGPKMGIGYVLGLELQGSRELPCGCWELNPIHLNTWSPVDGTVWEGIRRCDLVGGGVPLGTGSEVSEDLTLPSVLSASYVSQM